MASSGVILYDLLSKQGNICWSPNVWKTRLLLNYKGAYFTTKWIDFPDIEPVLKSSGVRPGENAVLGAATGAEYTLPAIRLPDGNVVMESTAIFHRVDNWFPSPSLKMEQDICEEVQSTLQRIARSIYPELAPLIRDNCLTDRGRAHWVTAREKLFGMSINELYALSGGDQAWSAADIPLKELDGILRTHKKDLGPFILGNEACYADLIIVAFLAAANHTSAAFFNKLVGTSKNLVALWCASQEWLENDG